MPHEDLIFDIGSHIGDDTENYLRRGYRVVAVDADPRMIGICQRRFSSEIVANRLILLHVGIEKKTGTLPFWVNREKDDWSSFDAELAKRNGTEADEIEVPCVTFESLLRGYGVPYYLKIDIEGRDLVCLEGLDRSDLPVYVSTEMYTTQQICHLSVLGYSRFKLVNQREHGGYTSGPFGEESSGKWRRLDEICYEWLHLHKNHRERCEFVDPDPNNWFDLHASA
jgi:FkbM family methyltransferase